MASNAHRSFFDQPKAEQKSLLIMLISNCSWANRELSVTFRQPFDILEEISLSEARVEAGNELQNGALPVWLPLLDTVRNLFAHPSNDIRKLVSKYRSYCIEMR
jgi:hypothetical protein